MSFEAEKVIQSVLEFYYSSGIISSKSDTISVKVEGSNSFIGNRQHYEQILFFVFGHLLPEFITPVIRVSSQINPLALLKTSFLLPGTSGAARDQLMTTIEEDRRLKKLLKLAGAETTIVEDEGQAVVVLFPVESVLQLGSEPVVNVSELKTRYDSKEIALTLLEGFVMNSRRHLTLLINAISKDDWQEAHRHAHALKGGALNVCAEAIVQRAKSIEIAIKDQHYDILKQAIQALETACSDLESTWSDYREELNG